MGRVSVLLCAGVVGCGAGARPAVGPQPAAACVFGDGVPGGTVTVAVAQVAEAAHAPAPRTPAERFMFRQLYETLVRIDCTGTVLPGLAESWSTDEQGRAWQFRLRGAASFSDGTPVTAGAVVESWSATPNTAARVSATFAAVSALGERDLRVHLRTPASQPHLFAHPDFAVAHRARDEAWPAGSGAFRIDRSTDARVIRLVQRAAHANAPPAIEFRTLPGPDPRVALDAGVDALVTAQPAAVEYARALPAYMVTPLPWSRTYALVARAPGGGADTLSGPPADALLALARDAVPAGTRAAEPPFWWNDAECVMAVRARPPSSVPRAGAPIVYYYPRGDAIARGIAERVVALAWPVARAPAWLRKLLPLDNAAGAPRAAAIDEQAAVDSVRTGRSLAFVVALPRTATGACTTLVPGDAPAALALVGTAGWRITPLLDAHDYLVQRRRLGRFTVEGDGIIVFGGSAP
jgi:hypothetical protein